MPLQAWVHALNKRQRIFGEGKNGSSGFNYSFNALAPTFSRIRRRGSLF